MVEADPRRSHGVGVDVVQKVLDRHILHREVELTGELAADQVGILGEKKNPLSRGQLDGLWWSHRLGGPLTAAQHSIS